ncbi:unnamed protein product [Closterium sp. NIES-64]|nr:unnamed protein product [Closterium sp. NIES-64]
MPHAPWRAAVFSSRHVLGAHGGFLPTARSVRAAVFCPPCAPRRAAVSCFARRYSARHALRTRGGFLPTAHPGRTRRFRVPSTRTPVPVDLRAAPRRPSRRPRQPARGSLSPLVAAPSTRAPPPATGVPIPVDPRVALRPPPPPPPPRTPAFAYRTPEFASRTPDFASRTLVHASRTPELAYRTLRPSRSQLCQPPVGPLLVCRYFSRGASYSSSPGASPGSRCASVPPVARVSAASAVASQLLSLSLLLLTCPL